MSPLSIGLQSPAVTYDVYLLSVFIENVISYIMVSGSLQSAAMIESSITDYWIIS